MKRLIIFTSLLISLGALATVIESHSTSDTTKTTKRQEQRMEDSTPPARIYDTRLPYRDDNDGQVRKKIPARVIQDTDYDTQVED